MARDDKLTEPRHLDVGYQRVDPVVDGRRGEVTRLAAPSGQIDCEHGQIRCQAVDFVDGRFPAVGGMLTTVDENKSGQRQFSPFVSRATAEPHRKVRAATAPPDAAK